MKNVFCLLFVITFASIYAQQTAPKGYQPSPTRSITGDFDSDGTVETLTQYISDVNWNEIKYIPIAPEMFKNDTITSEWLSYVKFYKKLNYYTRLKSDNKKMSGLNDINCQDLLLFINVGNVNDAKGDEIAIVTNGISERKTDCCIIYTWCKTGWKAASAFGILNDAFNYKYGSLTVFENIPGALEFIDGQWKYHNCYYNNPEDEGKMQPLRVPDCIK
jgi:hypothetical protein